jgi:hypothetical protein
MSSTRTVTLDVPGEAAVAVAAPPGKLTSNWWSPSKSYRVSKIGADISNGSRWEVNVTRLPATIGFGAQSKSAAVARGRLPIRAETDRADYQHPGREQKPDVTYPHPTSQRRRPSPDLRSRHRFQVWRKGAARIGARRSPRGPRAPIHGSPQGNCVPLLPDRRGHPPAIGLHAHDEVLERGFRLRRLPDAYEARRAERYREHKRSRLPVGIELLGQESRLSCLPHDRDKGTHGSHAAPVEADESELVPRSAGIDGEPAARFEPPDEQLVGHPRSARSPESPESCRTKGGRPGDGPARAAGVGHDHFELAVTARCAVDDRTPI